MPSLSNWVPLLVTVKLRVTAAHDPAGPQSVGGLKVCRQDVDLLNRLIRK